MARLAELLIVCVLASGCAAPPPTPSASPKALPSRADLQAAFERLGVRFQSATRPDGTTVLESTNPPSYSSSDRAFINVSIYGDPVHAVSINLPAVVFDSGGRFPGSALIDVMDSIDPGVKRWFVDQGSDPRLAGLAQELDLNGLIAQIPPIRVPGITVLVVESPPSRTRSNSDARHDVISAQAWSTPTWKLSSRRSDPDQLGCRSLTSRSLASTQGRISGVSSD
jgi:hypothetical protein